MDLPSLFGTGISPEQWEIAMRIALERLGHLGNSLLAKRKQNAEARQIIKTANDWPLSRCATILPFVGNGEMSPEVIPGLLDDGNLRFVIAVVWFAPFSAYHVGLEFDCEILVPPDPFSGDSRYVTYTAQKKVTDKLPNGEPEHLEGGSFKLVNINLFPTAVVSKNELGESSPAHHQLKMGYYVEVKKLKMTAVGPWKQFRDTEYFRGFSFYVPRLPNTGRR